MGRTLLPSLLVMVGSAWSAGSTPGVLAYFPLPSFKGDSLSIRQSRNFGQTSPASRTDDFARTRDGQGHPTLIEWRKTGDSTKDSGVQYLVWSQPIPNSHLDLIGTPTRTVEVDFLHGVEVNRDTTWNTWEPSTGTSVRTSTTQDSGCPWSDSSSYDTHGRLVSRTSCSLGSNGAGTYSDYTTYRAWYANATDSLPLSESDRDPSQATALLDTLFVVGDPNRPDSLVYNSSFVYALNRDGAGRVVLMNLVLRGVPISVSSFAFTYDSQGRLSREILPTDTTTYLYSWSDVTGIQAIASPLRTIRIVGHELDLELPSPDRVRVDILSLDGRHLATIANRDLPAGRSLVPLSARVGELVRVRTSQGESILRSPPR